MMMLRNSRVLRAIPLLIAVCFVSFPAQAQYGGGSGAAHDPYLIYTGCIDGQKYSMWPFIHLVKIWNKNKPTKKKQVIPLKQFMSYRHFYKMTVHNQRYSGCGFIVFLFIRLLETNIKIFQCFFGRTKCVPTAILTTTYT